MLAQIHTKFLETTKKIPVHLLLFGQTLLVIILIISVPFIYQTIRKTKSTDSQASVPTGTATLVLSPATTRFSPNTAQTVDLMFNTGTEKVDGVQAIITFTGTVPSNLVFTPSTIAGLSNVANTTTSVSGGKKVSIAFITSNPTQPYTTNSSAVKIGSFTFTAPDSGSLSVSFDTTLTTSIKNGNSQDILKTPDNATYTFASAPNQTQPSLSFSTLTPPNPQQVGSTFQVSIVANSGDQKLSGVDAQISFDPSVVEITSLSQDPGSPFPSFPEVTYDNQTGKVFVSANLGTSANPVPVTGQSIKIANITGKTKVATPSTTLQFVFNLNDRNDSNLSLFLEQQGQEPADILAKVENQTLVVQGSAATSTPGPTFTPTRTPTRTPTATPTTSQTAPNTVQFALQGKGRVDADKTAQLNIKAQAVGSSTSIDTTVTTNAAGQGQLSLTPNRYVLLVKTPGYLARKIGSTAIPVDLQGTTTTIDVSSTPLLGGDFNSDDEVNEIDYTLHFLTSFRETNQVVDLDSSGTVNNLDFSIMRSNWALESDNL